MTHVIHYVDSFILVIKTYKMEWIILPTSQKGVVGWDFLESHGQRHLSEHLVEREYGLQKGTEQRLEMVLLLVIHSSVCLGICAM